MRKPPEKGISTYKAVRENIDEPMVLFPEIPGNVESEIVGITPSRSTSSSARKRTVTYASHPSSRVLLAAAQTARDSIGAVAERTVRIHVALQRCSRLLPFRFSRGHGTPRTHTCCN